MSFGTSGWSLIRCTSSTTLPARFFMVRNEIKFAASDPPLSSTFLQPFSSTVAVFRLFDKRPRMISSVKSSIPQSVDGSQTTPGFPGAYENAGNDRISRALPPACWYRASLQTARILCGSILHPCRQYREFPARIISLPLSPKDFTYHHCVQTFFMHLTFSFCNNSVVARLKLLFKNITFLKTCVKTIATGNNRFIRGKNTWFVHLSFHQRYLISLSASLRYFFELALQRRPPSFWCFDTGEMYPPLFQSNLYWGTSLGHGLYSCIIIYDCLDRGYENNIPLPPDCCGLFNVSSLLNTFI